MKKKQIENQQGRINFYIENARMLSLSYEEQCKLIPDFAAWNLASDMANDWGCGDLEKLNQLFGKEIIGQNAIALHDTINKNFNDVSFNGPKYEEAIWTLEGLQQHPFWDEQRRLAKELLDELEKIKIN